MLVIGIAGPALVEHERDWLRRAAVGGVILFTRNFISREQVKTLCEDLRAAAGKPLLLCVDQEGGPVQRFREGFSRLPQLSRFGAQYDRDADVALADAERHAWLMAGEIRGIGIDLSFAPVVDLKRGNRAIGERAFHLEPCIAAELRPRLRARHACGRHGGHAEAFPGHGSVLEDTHFDAAVDPRALEVLRAEDLVPFEAGIAAGAEAVMMAHVSYPAVDADPAGYSKRWIRLLREELGFRGVVFSDDIGMAARNPRVAWRRASMRTTTPAAIRCWCARRAWCLMRWRRCRAGRCVPMHCILCSAVPLLTGTRWWPPTAGAKPVLPSESKRD